MNIFWYGQSCFKIQFKDIVLITDPFDKSIGLKPYQGQADVVTISHHHRDHDSVKAIKGTPFIIDGAGEYDVKGISIIGIPTYHDDKSGEKRGGNTVYVYEIEGMRICHLGDLGHMLSNSELEKIGQVDILFIPVGGVYTIDGERADEIINLIEPKIVVPMHYKISKLLIELDDIGKFAKEMGLSIKEKLQKLSIKKKDLPAGETKIIILENVND